MSFLSSIPVIGTLFEKLGEAIDRNITTDEERLKLKAELTRLYIPVLRELLQAQQKHEELQVRLAQVEAHSEHWLVWARRPVISILVVLNFLLTPFLHHMPLDMALKLALVVNGLDFGTRGLEKTVRALKEKDKI